MSNTQYWVKVGLLIIYIILQLNAPVNNINKYERIHLVTLRYVQKIKINELNVKQDS